MILTLAQAVPAGVEDRIRSMGEQIEQLSTKFADLADVAGVVAAEARPSRFEVLQGYLGVGVIAFLATLILTPLVRRLAIANGIVDLPSDARKVHRTPIAYLGGVAVYVGIMSGILYSYFAIKFGWLIEFHDTQYLKDGLDPFVVPIWVPLGLTVIMLVGLIDDVTGISPRVKLGGQLIATAALAYGAIGTNVAAGVLSPTLGSWLGNTDLQFQLFTVAESFPMRDWLTGGTGVVSFDLIYWTGTIIIAIFILGATNAANLIDGLDGLLTGVTSIATLGFLTIALALAVTDDGAFDAPRIVICLAVLGGCLGFLPHNFNPASIFLGDCGSLLLGYCAAVMILSLGNEGQTYLVIAGVIIYGIPITDTALAIVRRKLAGKRMSDPDADHLHHMLKRSLGVKGAVFALYGIGLCFAVLGVLIIETRARFVYASAIIFAAYIGVQAIKIARKDQLAEHTRKAERKWNGKGRAKKDPSPAIVDPEPVSSGSGSA